VPQKMLGHEAVECDAVFVTTCHAHALSPSCSCACVPVWMLAESH
jgi:hypothetical protein